ncbi:MAG: tetratricopeptide repeat protein, partial [Ruminococcus sp.]|nr:tetratricopeptide repeat protein [Ruminococcus sp.]
GEYDKALEYYEKALKICESVLGKEHPNTATTYNNIAVVYQDKGEYDKALEYYEKALKICESVLGKTHPLTVAISQNIALCIQ